MKKTGTNDIPLNQRITVNAEGLMALCSCGKSTALEIGNKSGAKLKIGKRTLYKVNAVMRYLEGLSET